MSGVPVVGTLEEALTLDPTTAIVGVPAGWPLPSGLAGAAPSVHRGGARHRERVARVPRRRHRAVRARPRARSRARDPRRPPSDLNVPTGANLHVDAKIVLTVGSDCAIGKKTVAVELDREARNRGLASFFCPTGQTGIAIAGWGIAVDAVVADFLAGAAERVVVEGAERRRQAAVRRRPGSLVHPLYSASRSASCTGLRRTRSSSATMRGRPRSKAARGT